MNFPDQLPESKITADSIADIEAELLAGCMDEPVVDRCRYCGKEFEEFGELGCEHCDLRVFEEPARA